MKRAVGVETFSGQLGTSSKCAVTSLCTVHVVEVASRLALSCVSMSVAPPRHGDALCVAASGLGSHRYASTRQALVPAPLSITQTKPTLCTW